MKLEVVARGVTGRGLTLAVAVMALISCTATGDLTSKPLSDEEFWALTTSLSEPPGVFTVADNLVSNELQFARVAERLRARGGVYIGVGPEQNFSYIVRLQPHLAFILDIRRENRDLHLMYKALFEISADRRDFLSRLFSRPRPSMGSRGGAVDDLFARVAAASPSLQVYEETRLLIRNQLVETHRWPLSPDELRSIDESLGAFLTDGPDIRYGRALPPGPARPSYRALMTAQDLAGRARSYLATDDAFAFVKALHLRNAIVPIVGDFAGPHSLRRLGDYIRGQEQLVSAFYSSNVEVYLTRDQQRTFCATLAALPYDPRTYFITANALQPLTVKLTSCAAIEPSLHWP